MLDGLGAGIDGALPIVMTADLGEGTGRFNLLRGTTYAAIGPGVAPSSVLGGFAVKLAGFTAAFATLAGIGVLATLFFARYVHEPLAARRDRPAPVQDGDAGAVIPGARPAGAR